MNIVNHRLKSKRKKLVLIIENRTPRLKFDRSFVWSKCCCCMEYVPARIQSRKWIII